jgi:hypothetical protein
MTALSNILQLPENKKEIQVFKNMVINELDSGEYDSVDIAIRFKALETLLKEIQKDSIFKELTVEQAEKNGDTYQYKNAKSVQIVEAGTKYDFDNCEDDVLNDMCLRFFLLVQLLIL